LAGCHDDDFQCQPLDRAGAAEPAFQLRDPFSGTCQFFGGGGDCDDPCGRCPPTGIAQPDWAQCNAQCESLDESTCKTTSGCRAVYAGAAFHECWGTAPSGPTQGGDCTTFDAQECSRHDDCVAKHAAGAPIGTFNACAPEGSIQDPGSCVGNITCTTPAPQCPMNTLPGKRNGCWTGYCIPIADCDQLPACDTLGEKDCIGRSDCAPTYTGQNCSCTPNGCTCATWLFKTCEDK